MLKRKVLKITGSQVDISPNKQLLPVLPSVMSENDVDRKIVERAAEISVLKQAEINREVSVMTRIRPDEPSHDHWMFSRGTRKAEGLNAKAMLSMFASQNLNAINGFQYNSLEFYKNLCIAPRHCPTVTMYQRMPDGSCNNLQFSNLGKANSALRRIKHTDYSDGINASHAIKKILWFEPLHSLAVFFFLSKSLLLIAVLALKKGNTVQIFYLGHFKIFRLLLVLSKN